MRETMVAAKRLEHPSTDPASTHPGQARAFGLPVAGPAFLHQPLDRGQRSATVGASTGRGPRARL